MAFHNIVFAVMPDIKAEEKAVALQSLNLPNFNRGIEIAAVKRDHPFASMSALNHKLRSITPKRRSKGQKIFANHISKEGPVWRKIMMQKKRLIDIDRISCHETGLSILNILPNIILFF